MDSEKCALLDEYIERGIRFADKAKSPLMRVLGWLLAIVTLGRARFDGYWTTIGNRVWMPMHAWRGPMLNFREVIEHEAHHVAQFRRAGLGSAWLGVVVIAPLYLLLPVPVGLAWGRWRIERTAYVAGAMAALDRLYPNHIAPVDSLDAIADEYAASVSGPSYGWAWPRRWARRWFLKALIAADSRRAFRGGLQLMTESSERLLNRRS